MLVISDEIAKSNLDKAGNENLSEAAGVNTQLNRAPTITNPTVSRVANSTSELTITATATDQDEKDVLTYKLLRGTSANDANPTELALAPEKIEGRTVTFKDTGLSMDTYYWYKIKVSDGIDNNISGNYGSERTYCLGNHCDGFIEITIDCNSCETSGKLTCPSCSAGYVTKKCTKTTYNGTMNHSARCTTCGQITYTSGKYCTTCGARPSIWCICGCGGGRI